MAQIYLVVTNLGTVITRMIRTRWWSASSMAGPFLSSGDMYPVMPHMGLLKVLPGVY